MIDEKAALRRALLDRRRALGRDAQIAAATAVRAHLLAWPGLRGPVFAYASQRGELGTRALLVALREVGHDVLLPRITARGVMEAARWDGVFADGAFGIPTASGPVVEPVIALVPGVAFDRDGGRLGQGGGYYDRWLAAHPAVCAIGLCHDEQIVDAVPMAATDQRVRGLLTPSGWIREP